MLASLATIMKEKTALVTSMVYFALTIYEQMGRTPPWAKDLVLRADGYETYFYKKD